jgi:hypothetical protein
LLLFKLITTFFTVIDIHWHNYNLSNHYILILGLSKF